jgi:hypothetical protein
VPAGGTSVASSVTRAASNVVSSGALRASRCKVSRPGEKLGAAVDRVAALMADDLVPGQQLAIKGEQVGKSLRQAETTFT